MIKTQLEEILGYEIEATENPDFGDYSSNIALKNKDLDPQEIANKINNQDLPFTAKVVGRFINFWLKTDVLVSNLTQIDKEKEKYGSSDIGKGKTVVIDYSAPNIAKPFGIGHLRSTIIGQALYNFYQFSGYEVVGDNHLGDWGTQFGKLLYMIDSTKTKDFSIENLEKLYVEFHKLAIEDPKLEESAREWFKKLEDGDDEAKSIWQKCIDISLAEFDRIYDLLGVKIDFAFGESYYQPFLSEIIKKGEKSQGAIVVNIPGFVTPLMLAKSDGASTYATRDLATIKFRVKKWDPDIIIYEVGAEQSLHFQQLFGAAKILGLVDEKVNFIHTKHGLYLAPDGKKFSTRKGKTIKLDEVLTEAIERAKKMGSEDEENAKKVGIGAIKYFDLMHSVQSNVVFDWEKIMNMEGNSGPYLQYTVARTNSVLAKARISNLEFGIWNLNDEELSVLRSLIRFSEIVSNAAKNYSPNLLCNYLYDLASKYNAFYNKNRVLESNNEEFRLKLTSATGQVLKNGLKLLGIDAPEKM